MERFSIISAIGALLLTLSAYSHSVDFSEIERWSADKRYHRGDVVAVDYDIYINLLSRKGLHPEDSRKGWRKVRYTKQYSFGDRRLFLPGQVVVHEGKNYISRRMNLLHRPERLYDSRRWLEFSHPGLTYDLPDVNLDDDSSSLTGSDSNDNGIRDDYEVAIIFSGLPPAVVDSALDAGKAYGALLEMAQGAALGSEEQARSTLIGVYLAQQCKRQRMRENEGTTWTEATYFNTIDRIEAKFKLQEALVDNLSEDPLEPPVGDPCDNLNSH